MKHTALACALAATLSALPVRAESTPEGPRRPLWELGAGVAAVQLPDYVGADVSHRYLLPVPFGALTYLLWRRELHPGRAGTPRPAPR